MVVDDASVLSPKHCQAESWTQRTPSQTEYWAVPACNVGGTWEIAAGLGRIAPDDRSGAYRSGVVQAKTVFKPLQTNSWGIGLTIANQSRLGGGMWGDLTVMVPVSVSLQDDRLLLHANGGLLYQNAGNRRTGTWAVGAEWAAHKRLVLTLEAYGSGHGPSYRQAGLRFNLIPDRLSFDTGIGGRLRGGEPYATFGLSFAGQVWR
ncbi:MAG: hypothetical protein V7631_1558 [Massilia sp.]|jgi:hypothetical protein